MKRLFVLTCLLLLTGCAAQNQIMDGDGMVRSYTQIDQETAKRMMDQDDNHIVVDVRRQDEYDAGHIPGAILIPNESIGTTQPAELPDLDQIILIYCRSGNRSKQAAQKLFDMGYSNVYEFGGIIDWTGDIVTDVQDSKTAVLQFSSFDGGGHEYSVSVEEPEIVTWTSERRYGDSNHEIETGSRYDMIFTFTGTKPGTTTLTVSGRSPILENEDSIYAVTVNDDLNVTLTPVRKISTFFLYRNGEIFYNSYQITMEEDGYRVSVNEGEERPLSTETVDALLQVIEEYDLIRWDGFNQAKDNVLDGEGFWLEIAFTDGTSITARGDNAFPEGFFPAMSEMQNILDAVERTP